jgi:putative Mg2+ transporter-C (MgtC) family protein
MLITLYQWTWLPTVVADAYRTDPTRMAQGIMTGIGFLGAGVIVRSPTGEHIHGLTTAAVTWLTACVGLVCGVAEWRVIIVGLPLVFIVLRFGGPLEKAIRHRFRGPGEDDIPG